MNGGLRDVVHEERFEREAAEIQPDFQRMDEALRYVEEQLAREPESGIQTDVPGIWVAPVRVPHEGRIARASIFYTVEPERVRLQSIRLAL